MMDSKEQYEPELFMCYLCEKYLPISKLKLIYVKGSFMPKDICDKCLEKIEEKGLTKKEALFEEKGEKKDEDKKSEKVFKQI